MSLSQGPEHSNRKATSRETDDGRRTALHHAAHGVIGCILDVPYTSIALGCTDDDHLDITLANQHALHHRADLATAWQHVRRVVMFALAGCVAEWHEHPDESGRINVDTAEVMAALTTLTDDAPSTFIEIAEATLELVHANWACVERVAGELLVRGRLTHQDVELVIDGQTIALPEMTVEGGARAN